ncbi:penicillin-binding transpeptidase domain-containing protein [Kitasatospora camelliae]|uniref:Penicillin-binding transpeptidase domain-containing protein n=1 Tax=Kitasatospora camelliae TaxID=3156397 RepID=A0AAU8K6S9_9ACTN
MIDYAEDEPVPDGEEEPSAPRARPGRRALKIGAAVVFGAMVAVGGYGVYNIAHAIMGGSKGGTTPAADGPTAASRATGKPPTAEHAAATAKEFLDAWARGDLPAAAALTDRKDNAADQLAAFQQALRPREVTLAATGPQDPAQAAPGSQAAVAFHARLLLDGTDRAWEYDGRLGLVGTADGRTAVHWAPGAIHPQLTTGSSLAVQSVPAPPGRLLDRNGTALDASSPAGKLLAGVTGGKADGGQDGGATGRAVVLTSSGGKAPEPLFVLTEATGPEQRVTLDAELQRTAEAALAKQTSGGRAGSLVAVEPSTGRILAVASAPAGGFNRAFGGGIAPGSTLKVVSAAALLESGLEPDSATPCKDTATSPKVWHNDERGDHSDYTLAEAFARSCNTAFIEQGLARLAPGTLAKVAGEQFGLGLTWHIGVPTFDGRIPVPGSRDEQAAEYIGQGGVQVNTLAMASVAATVQNGTFRQPYLVDGTRRATAQSRLPAKVAADLRAMMARTAASGTARRPMSGLGGQVGAKTGTAEVDGKNPNSWFVAYRGDLAVAVEVEGAGHGADAAGQVAAKVLRVGNGR